MKNYMKGKKMVLVIAGVLLVGSIAFAADATTKAVVTTGAATTWERGTGHPNPNGRHMNFVDANKDGVNDRFVDANKDGICDNSGNANNNQRRGNMRNGMGNRGCGGCNR